MISVENVQFLINFDHKVTILENFDVFGCLRIVGVSTELSTKVGEYN